MLTHEDDGSGPVAEHETDSQQQQPWGQLEAAAAGLNNLTPRHAFLSSLLGGRHVTLARLKGIKRIHLAESIALRSAGDQLAFS